MGYAGVPCKCPICGKQFRGQSYHVYKMRAQGRQPTCSRQCEQERRHAASRDAKWAEQQAKLLRKEDQ